MKPVFSAALAALAAAVSAHGQAVVKAGVSSPVSLQLTIYANGVAGARYSNREVLTAMNDADLLDGSITGWVLNRFTDDNDSGNIYAAKQGKPAVAVPATILVQPVATGRAKKPVSTTSPVPTNVAPSYVYGTFSAKNGAGSFSGLSSVKATGLKVGTTAYDVITRTETLNVSGRIDATTVYIGSYRVANSTPTNIARFFPDSDP